MRMLVGWIKTDYVSCTFQYRYTTETNEQVVERSGRSTLEHSSGVYSSSTVERSTGFFCVAQKWPNFTQEGLKHTKNWVPMHAIFFLSSAPSSAVERSTKFSHDTKMA